MGRDIDAITITGEDRRRYRDKVRRSLDVFARMLREHRFESEPAQVGVEIELNLVDGQGEPSMRNADVLDAIADPAWATELGQFNLEINVPPRELAGDAAGQTWRARSGPASTAPTSGPAAPAAAWSWSASCPRLREEHMHEDTISANARYRVLNEQIFAARGEDMRIAIDGPERLLTHAGSITPEAACTSVQLHLQVCPEEFANYWNAAQAIAGVQVALAANSPYLFGRRLWDETRITLFEQATDTRPDELQASGRAPPGLVRRAVDHLGVRPVRGEHPVLPGAAAAVRRRRSAWSSLDRGGCPQLAEMSLHNGTVYRWNRPVYAVVGRRAAPAGGKPGAARRADGRGRHRQRGVLLRPAARPRRGGAPDLDPALVRHRGREPARGGAARHRRAAVLARPRRSARGRARAAAAAAAGPRGPGPLGRRRPATPTACWTSSSSAA